MVFSQTLALKAPENCRLALVGTFTLSITLARLSAPLTLPLVVQVGGGVPERVPALPVPEESAAVAPKVSSSFHQLTKPVETLPQPVPPAPVGPMGFQFVPSQ